MASLLAFPKKDPNSAHDPKSNKRIGEFSKTKELVARNKIEGRKGSAKTEKRTYFCLVERNLLLSRIWQLGKIISTESTLTKLSRFLLCREISESSGDCMFGRMHMPVPSEAYAISFCELSVHSLAVS